MKFKEAIKPYQAAAGGWGSLEATTRFVFDSKQVLKNMRNLMRMNKAKGFDCPGCAWGDDNKSTFSFCENGAKAVTWEATPAISALTSLPSTVLQPCITRAITSSNTRDV